MNFWNFLGLANKKDISYLTSEMKSLKELLNGVIPVTYDIKIKSGDIENTIVKLQSKSEENQNNMVRSLSEMEERIDLNNKNIIESLNDMEERTNENNKNINYSLTGLEEKSVENRNSIISSLNDMQEKNVTFNSKLSTDIQNIQSELYGVLSEINESTKANLTVTEEEGETLKQLINEVKLVKNNIESLNKDIAILQQMIRVVWVNDLTNTLDTAKK